MKFLANSHKLSVYDSSRIPGEIIDLMVVNTKTLKDNPSFGKALVGAWYETMALMQRDDAAGKAAREVMAKASGTDLAGFDGQLATTKMFYFSKDAVGFTESEALPWQERALGPVGIGHGMSIP